MEDCAFGTDAILLQVRLWMDSVYQKHLQRIAMKHHGEEELLELLLTITVYLLCQCLYRCALPWDELEILTECMAEYVVPGDCHERKVCGKYVRTRVSKVSLMKQN